jgi:hypothetical protein
LQQPLDNVGFQPFLADAKHKLLVKIVHYVMEDAADAFNRSLVVNLRMLVMNPWAASPQRPV